jgi:demethylmenaquinone methyltransferase/2-methoxy-6-polyprenyl-1,4-benzoquinol methylase
MANLYYNPGIERASRVRDLFAIIASRYDRINDLQSFGLHRLWKRRLIRLARPRSGERALDLCCGTGDIAARLSRLGLTVVGLDFSHPMLEVARNKHLGSHRNVAEGSPPPMRPVPGAMSDTGTRTGLTFMQGDAQRLPFPDASFDLVTVGYGLRNLSDWRAGLHEMWRVLRPDGRLVALDFGKPSNGIWRGVYFGYLRCCVPVMGKIFCGNAQAYAYILESLRHYPAQRGVDAHLRSLGGTNLRLINILGGAMSINAAWKT